MNLAADLMSSRVQDRQNVLYEIWPWCILPHIPTLYLYITHFNYHHYPLPSHPCYCVQQLHCTVQYILHFTCICNAKHNCKCIWRKGGCTPEKSWHYSAKGILPHSMLPLDLEIDIERSQNKVHLGPKKVYWVNDHKIIN